jgi:conjugative transfer signal peptidase TraF
VSARLLRGRIALVLTAFVLAGCALVAARAAGLRVNTTASMPEGIYRLSAYDRGALARGTIVAICPSADVRAVAAARHYFEPGPCPGDVEPLLKHVAAVSGDQVGVTDRGISVNGRLLPNSGRLARDCAGRPLARIPAGRYTIAPNTVWLYGPVARSWDSRYFGPQPATGIVGIAKPILIVGTPNAACPS